MTGVGNRRFGSILAMLLALAVAAGAAAQPEQPAAEPVPATPSQWAAAAERDVDAAHDLLRDNHPGMVDPANPGFARQLAHARAIGRALARRVRTPMGYDAAIAAFGNALQDGHAGAFATLPAALRPARRWPGFVPAWRGDRLVVQFSDDPVAVPRGATIASCDGTDVAALVRRNVFRFRGRASEAGNWWVQARNVLIDTGNPFVRPPATCRLHYEGRSWTERLRWRVEEGTQLADWRTAGYNGTTLAVGLTRPAAGLTWIALPDFDPDAATITRYREMFASIRRDRTAILAGRAIVLDLRDNQGGSSEWSRDLAEELWGEAAVQSQMGRYFAHTTVTWRASAGNEAHVRGAAPGIRAAGYGEVADQWLALADAMSAARAAGRAIVDEPPEPGSADLPPLTATDLTLPVYVIVPGQCASACLDALDVFTRFPTTRLIGAPSSGDSKYMEVRSVVLPSGLASVTIPNKMWNNRPRGHGAGYAPAIVVTDLDWSTADFLRTVERDLAGD